MDIAEAILNLMAEQGITKYRLAKDSKVPYTTLIKILDGTTKHPQIDSLKLIADYFGKPVDHFTNNEDTEKKIHSVLSPKEERDIAADLERMINDLESKEALAFHGEPMDENTKELMRISLENSLRLAKGMAKQKFNPNKNK